MSNPPIQRLSLGGHLAVESESRGRDTAVICGDESATWTDLHVRSNRLAHALAARGVKLGDYVTIGLQNSVAFVDVCYAAWKLGAVPQPVSWRLPPLELSAIIELAMPSAIIAEAVSPKFDDRIVSVADLLAESANMADLPDRISPSWKAPTSGGSTGRPKLIVSGTPGLANTQAGAAHGIYRDSIALIPGPLYHTGPFASAFYALQAGARLILMPRFDAEETLRAIDRHRVTWLTLVPTMMSRISRLPKAIRDQYDVSSLQTVFHMAAPCPPWLKEEWIDWLGAEKIMEIYGGTEAQAGCKISGTEWLSHRGSVGRVASGQMRVVSADGIDVSAGQTGEIFMKQPDGVPPSYRYVGADAHTLPGGWESLGDIGWFDSDGYLYLADRRTDMILVGGSNVYPAEVEAAIEEHARVLSSAVVGLPDDDMGNRIHAIVQAEGILDIDELQRHLADRLVAYKRPRTFEFVEFPLRDDAGKLRRSALREARINR